MIPAATPIKTKKLWSPSTSAIPRMFDLDRNDLSIEKRKHPMQTQTMTTATSKIVTKPIPRVTVIPTLHVHSILQIVVVQKPRMHRS